MSASQTVVIANSAGEMPTCAARASATGVSSTAVVSRDSTMVEAVASSTINSQSAQVRPRPTRAARWAAASNTPAFWASWATTVIATRNTRTGAIRRRIDFRRR